VAEELLDRAIATAGGRELWSGLRGLKIDLSVGGPIWATKGWPPGKTFDQTVTLDTIREQIVFCPFTRPDRQMVFDAATDSVTMQTLGYAPPRLPPQSRQHRQPQPAVDHPRHP